MELSALGNPNRYYRKLQHIYYSFSGRYLKINKEQTIYLLQTPVHNNIGDQTIAYAEIMFLTKFFPEYSLKIVNELQLKSALKRIASKSSNNDIIMIHGGGNMGDIWPGYEEERQNIIKTLSKKKIVSFPQSIKFSSDDSLLAKNSKEIYSKAYNLTLVARENTSYNKMLIFFDDRIKKLYTPDIVLSLDPIQQKLRENDITTFLRSDVEKKLSDKSKLFFDQMQQKFNVTVSDTVSDYIPFITNSTREKFVLSKMVEFSRSKLIITDRLHGMIFAMLTGTPAIIFDNNNKKVSSTYKSWLRDTNFLYLAEDYSIQELNEIVYKYVNSNKTEAPNNKEVLNFLHKEFEPLIEEINKK